MNLSEQYAVIEEVLVEFHTCGQPIKENIVAQIISQIQQRTGNETFAGIYPADLKV